MPNNNIAHSAAQSKQFSADTGKISHFLSLVHPDTAFEITVFPSGVGKPKSIITTGENFEEDFEAIGGAQNVAGCYVGLNPSSQNRGSRKRNTAETIASRRHLVIDIDGCKNGKTPEARETLRTKSIELAKKIAADLTAEGFPEPVTVNSGNGAQMWYRISAETGSDIVSRCLKALDARYKNEAPLHIDTGIGDAARIGRLPGTWNCKKDYPENEWRMAEIVSEPFLGTLDEVPHTCLEELAKDIPSTGAGNSSAAKEVEGLEYDTEENRDAFRQYLNTRDGGVEGERGRYNLLETARFGGDFGLSPAAVVEELTTYERAGDGTTYNERCEPPWDISKMETVVANSYKGRKESVGCKSPEYKRQHGLECFEALPPGESNGEAAGVTTEESESLLDRFRKRLHKGDYYLSLEETDLDYWVDGLLPAEDFLVDVCGAPGCGKSTFIHQLCICVLNGVDFLGHATHPETKSGKVFKPLIVSCEEPEKSIARRMKAQAEVLCGRNGKTPDVLDLLGEDTTFYQAGAKSGSITDQLKAVMAVVKEGGYNFVAIDNRGEVFRADENNRDDVSRFCGPLKATCRSLRAQLVMLSHTNKRGAESGSTAWTGSGRVQIRMDANDKNEEIAIQITKANDVATGRWETVKFMPKEGGKPGECLPVLIPTVARISEEDLLDMVVNAVEAAGAEGIQRKPLYKKLKEEPFFESERNKELVDLALKKGLIEEVALNGGNRRLRLKASE